MEQLKKLQSKLLIMLEWFHEFCVNNNLTYYLCGGSMLGAARHQGFIPWDDDIDVMMPREDIKKLEELLNNTSGKYVLESPTTDAKDYLYSFSKLYDTTTILVENTKHKIKRGIYLDIFPLDGMGNTWEDAEKHMTKIRKTFNLLLCKTTGIRKGRKWYKNAAVFLFRAIPLNEKKLLRKLVSLCEERSWNDCELSGNPVGAYAMKEIMPKSVYGTPTLYKFEDIEVYGVENYDEYLTRIYGEWQKLPPEEKRVSHHDYIDLDLETSYMGE